MNGNTLTAFCCLLTVTAGQATGATLTNLDADPFMFIVTEDGERTEAGVREGETLEFCLHGCFVVLPNGNRAALTGDEIIEVSGGRVKFK
jgi:phosphopantothenate synthetase